MNKEIKNWITDKLIDILGFSDSVVEEFLFDITSRSSSFPDFLTKAREKGLAETFDLGDGKVKGFFRELYLKVPKSSSNLQGLEVRRENSNEKKTVIHNNNNNNDGVSVLRNKRDDGGRKGGNSGDGSGKKDLTGRKRERKIRKKEKFSIDNQDELVQPVLKRGKKIKEERRLEEERRAYENDVKEKEEFEKKMMFKYQEEQHGGGGRGGEKNEQRERSEKKRKEKLINQRKIIEQMRELSRRKYLGDREKKMIEVAKQNLEEDKRRWGDNELSESELKYRKIQEEVINMVEKKEKRSREGKLTGDHYQLPESYFDPETQKSRQKERFEVMKGKYVDNDNKGEKEKSAFREWEERQLKSAKILKKTYGDENEEDLDLVFDDQIEFIADSILKGTASKEFLKKLEEEKKKQKEEYLSPKEKLQKVRNDLPIFSHRKKIMDIIKKNKIVIIVGETGSGKTTQIPQYLFEDGYSKGGKKIGCTQPRRVAAMSVATRVSVERGCKLGELVGYNIRFDDRTTEDTRIKYMTDGMLLREFISEPDLAQYSCMMIDEAHERSIHSDILFALVKDVTHFRDDFRLIVSSATLQAEKFSKYFDDAPVIHIPGRTHHVDILYTKQPEHDYLEACVVTILQIHITQPRGDVLAFFTGQEDIESCEELLKERIKVLGKKAKEMIIVPIYGQLPSDQQVKIFMKTPPNARKVVLATNIAETSLTIDEIKYVIDTGFCKQNTYDPKRSMESLIVTPISKQNASQRAGRAGRTSPGKCFRLYTSWSFEKQLPDVQVPEIQRTNLANVVLLLKSLGINDLLNFDFMDPPPSSMLIYSLELLYALGALNDKGFLTALGRKMAEFPLDPRLSRVLIESEKNGVAEEVAAICGILSVSSSIFYRPKDKIIQADHCHKSFYHEKGDHLSLLNVWNEWKETNYSSSWTFQNFLKIRSLRMARYIKEQLTGLMERIDLEVKSNPTNVDGITKSFVSGFFFNTALLSRDGNYRTFHKPQIVNIHPSSCLFESTPKWVFYHQLVFTSKEFMREVTEIDPSWLLEIAPHIYKTKKNMIEDKQKKMPKFRRRKV